MWPADKRLNYSTAKRIAVALFGPTARVTKRAEHVVVYAMDPYTMTLVIHGEGEGFMEALMDCFEADVVPEKSSALDQPKSDSNISPVDDGTTP